MKSHKALKPKQRRYQVCATVDFTINFSNFLTVNIEASSDAEAITKFDQKLEKGDYHEELLDIADYRANIEDIHNVEHTDRDNTDVQES